MESIWSFWKTCVVRAAKGASPFANDWQWVWGVPVWQIASGTSLFTWLFVGASISDGHGGMTTGHPWLDGLIAALAAFVITWFIAFVCRIFSVAAERYNEAVSRADALGVARSDAELRMDHTRAIEEHTKALREQTASNSSTSVKSDADLSYSDLASRIRDLAAKCRTEMVGRGDNDIDFRALYDTADNLKVRVSGTALEPIVEPVWTNLQLCLGALDTIARLAKRDAEGSSRYRYEEDIMDERGRLIKFRYATLAACDTVMKATAEIVLPAPRTNEESPRLEMPYDIDARAALRYAVTGVWGQKLDGSAAELGLVFDALGKFHDLAGAGAIQVWGRPDQTRPLKLIDKDVWQNWHIEHPPLYAESGAEPLRTLPIKGLPLVGQAYYDIRLKKSEVEHFWPPKKG